ncbi:FtsE-like ATP binding protein in cell division [Bifidobacterium ramosum]|uniref:Cell division ATP-binding protein FtsE n=1 Tax=Bifidobacterium ramosum TaxID=1798158 RepID=A0A6L4X0C4_9BIFI|nr:cell division ATP-binding protein FtsE [Bifidobacterium ramosum]KAB8287955.1 FtsE-like ATP binding protein in cell division [Bifidobacterium ramosum]NEG72012.1 cell division ATP-binding protein FtsE [Bifidobacterium ramosum]
MALISLDHVSKIYPRGTRPALDDVNLHIDRGDFVFLVGASGSGKTTLLSLLLREEEATDGEIHVAGNDLRRLSNRQVPQYRRSIGFIFQDYKLLNNKTVWQNVAFALEVIGTRRSTIKSLVPKVLETVGLTGKENSYPHELSGGEQQRVTIARAYVNHPQILLADEPTGNLDPTTSLGIMEVLDAINRTGTTIVMATHNEEIVNSMRKRVVELHAGKIVRDERQGSYDSALYFPDAEVESRSKQALGVPSEQPQFAAPQPTGTRVEQAERIVEHVSEVINGDETNEGIARLANSVHSGRTGRYGEAFAPVETTLTWGRGLRLDEYAAGKSDADAADDAKDSDGADDSVATSADANGTGSTEPHGQDDVKQSVEQVADVATTATYTTADDDASVVSVSSDGADDTAGDASETPSASAGEPTDATTDASVDDAASSAASAPSSASADQPASQPLLAPPAPPAPPAQPQSQRDDTDEPKEETR